MDANSQQQIDQFFDAISPWRIAYVKTRLSFIAKRVGQDLTIISARISLDSLDQPIVPKRFCAGDVEAWQCDIAAAQTAEQVLSLLVEGDGLLLEGDFRLKIAIEQRNPAYVAPPILFHPEGLSNGNRIAVLTVSGTSWAQLLPQPETDWALRAADQPYDSIQELSSTFGLGTLRGDRSIVEVVARSVIEVLASSAVNNTVAKVGVWMAKSLDRAKARIGYRVQSSGGVVIRAAVDGRNLAWINGDVADEGETVFDVPRGAIVQCFASYSGHTHHVQWRVDPKSFQNPRAAVLTMADPQKSFQGFLHPDANARNRAADDFEDGIAWLVWTLGFSTASFGANPKTKDAYDIVAVSPRGDFMVIECTVGLLRAESKLSKLVARAAGLRSTLDDSGMRQFKVLPVIVSALSNEQLRADIGVADESKVLVVSREGIDELLTEQYRFPDADAVFDRAWQAVQDRHAKRLAETTVPPQND